MSKKVNYEVILCVMCRGTGQIQPPDVLVRKSCYDSDWEKQPVKPCNYCKGTGKLVKETKIYALDEMPVYFNLTDETVKPKEE